MTSYDEVMALRWGADEGADIGLAHPVLPVPSYVEVTRLDTGKTILVRVARRADPNQPALGQLSSAAAHLLALDDKGEAAFRVRRVNPTDQDKEALRLGQSATPRLDTPDMLLIVLRKKAAALSYSSGPTAPLSRPARLHPQQNSAKIPAASASKAAQRDGAPSQESGPDQGPWFVQIAALSSADRARQLATEQGGKITPANGLFRVRTGPYASRDAARAALGRLSSKGYPDARITR
ncbi:MAG: SPOR domain-containing protein [Chakrabartia sp.]